MKQNINNNDTSREVILTESKTMRKEYIENEQNYDILDKIKALPYLTDDMVLSVEQVSNYYEVSNEAIKTVIKRHRDELEEDGIMTLKGGELKEFKNKVCEVHIGDTKLIGSKTTALNLLNRSNVLLIAFYLQNNDIANKIKSELLSISPESYKYYSDITLSVGYKKRHEKGFEEVLYPLLHKYNKIKKQVRCNNYRIDFVINDLIAIEIDENGHEGYDTEDELKREKCIKDNGYVLMRFNPDNKNCFEFIGEIIQLIHNSAL